MATFHPPALRLVTQMATSQPQTARSTLSPQMALSHPQMASWDPSVVVLASRALHSGHFRLKPSNPGPTYQVGGEAILGGGAYSDPCLQFVRPNQKILKILNLSMILYRRKKQNPGGRIFFLGARLAQKSAQKYYFPEKASRGVWSVLGQQHAVRREH